MADTLGSPNQTTDTELTRLGRDFDKAAGDNARSDDGSVQKRWSALANRIHALPAKSLAELAVKARVLGDALGEDVWARSEPERDWTDALTTELIEQLCAAAGMDRFGNAVSVGSDG